MVIAAAGFAARLRECRESESEIQTTSNGPRQAKYMWLMCGRPPGQTVAREQRGDAFISLRARRSNGSDETRRDLRSIVTPLVWTESSLSGPCGAPQRWAAAALDDHPMAQVLAALSVMAISGR